MRLVKEQGAKNQKKGKKNESKIFKRQNKGFKPFPKFPSLRERFGDEKEFLWKRCIISPKRQLYL